MIIKKYKSRTKNFRVRLFWKRGNKSRRFEAGFLEAFGYIIWIFRNKDVYNGWPSCG